MCKAMLCDTPQPLARICEDVWMESVIATRDAVVVMKVRETVADAFANDTVVGVFTDGTLGVDNDMLFLVENDGMLVFEFILPAAEATLCSTDVLTEESVDTVFGLLIDSLVGILAGEMAGIFPCMDAVDVGIAAWFGVAITVWKCILSASLETSFFSSSASCSCWSTTVSDCDRALQAWKPSDHS